MIENAARLRPGVVERARMPRGASALVLLAALAAALPVSVLAQTQPAAAPHAAPAKAAPAQSDDEGDDDATTVSSITVRPSKPQPGAVVGDIKPELQLSPSDIQSFGVSTVTELLNELQPETRSDRGRGGQTPVILLNGRRISSFNEIQNIPTEAILRVDILPEEVSLKYGYTADQRVVNIVLRRRFHAVTVEGVGGQATEGGDTSGQAELDLLHLRGDDRLNLDLKYQSTDALTDADRDLTANPPGVPYDLTGNVVSPTAGGQIDPALSALAGRPVTVAGVPAVAANGAPSLADFGPTAGVPNTTNVAGDRTLTPATRSLTANAVLSRPIFDGIRATVNATVGATTSDSLQGLPGIGLLIPAGDPYSPFSQGVMLDRYVGAFGPLRQDTEGLTGHLGSTLNRDIGDWRLSLTDAYDYALSQTTGDAGVAASPLQALLNADSASFNPFGALPASLLTRLPRNTASSTSNAANMQFLANGPALTLPAGQLYVSAKFGDTQSWLDSTSDRFGVDQNANLARNDANAQLNVDLPLTSRTHHVLSPLGELSVNGNVAVDELSDFGLLKTFGYGVNWTPFSGVNFIVSHTSDHMAPTPQQLDGPTISTPGTRIFDYATGQTVDVTLVSGGNDKLTADSRGVLKVGLTLKPLPTQDLTLTANYVQSRIDNAIGSLPAASAQIEAAFPGRFVRDSEGDLTEEDDRAVNFAREDRQEIRWGINYSRPIGKQPPPRFDRRAFAGARRPPGAPGDGGPDGGPPPGGPADGDGNRPGGAPGGGGDGGGPRRGGGGGGGGGGRGGFGDFAGGGRLQLAIYHTFIFQDRILVAPGGPVLDLLNGAPAGDTGGQPRQEIEAQAGFTLKGVGARISADWKSGTFVNGGAGSPTGDLSFSDIATVNLRLFDNLGQQRSVVRRFPFLRGSRVTLNVINLFDERLRVRDAAGITPISYQPAYLDPAGRTVSLSFRKLFY